MPDLAHVGIGVQDVEGAPSNLVEDSPYDLSPFASSAYVVCYIMAYLLIDHTVDDYGEWKPYFDDHASARGEGGSKGGQLFHKEGEPNEIVALFEWDSLENAHEFAASDDLRDTMEEAGVVGEPELHFLEKIEDISE